MKKIVNIIIVYSCVFGFCPDNFYEDSCGNCWMAYCYDYISHDVQYDLSEDECSGNTNIWVVPSDESNDPYFNNFCNDECPENFIIDECGHCWQNFCYTFFSPGLDGDPLHSVYYDLTIDECESYGYNYYLADHPSSPYFNSNCSDDQGDDGGAVDECEECLEGCVAYVVENYGYSYEDAAYWCNTTSDSGYGCADTCFDDQGDDGGAVDECEECLEGCVAYVVENYGYSYEDAAYWCNTTPDSGYGCADTCFEWEVCSLGDVNEDNQLNVSDIVSVVSFILNESEFSEQQFCSADFNEDSIVNVVDIVAMIDVILNSRSSGIGATKANIIIDGSKILIKSNGIIQGIQLELFHINKIEIDLIEAFISDYNTYDNFTTIIIVSDGSNITEIGNIIGDYEIVSSILVNSESLVVDVGEIAYFPRKFSLESAFPNPFNPSTNIRLMVSESGHISVKIYNIIGQQVDVLVDRYIQESNIAYNFYWDAGNLPSGTYFVRAHLANQIETQKVMLIK